MGKYVAGILGFIALAWIIYVGINIASFREPVSPYSVFPARETILVANRPFNYEQVSATGIIPGSDLLRSIFENPERVQHIYIGAHGGTLLLERSKPWTIELTRNFLKRNGLSSEFISSRKLKLSNGWYAAFDGEFLALLSGDRELIGDNAVQWNYLDKKSAYSVVRWNEAYPLIENVYRSADGTVLYISAQSDAGVHLADDQDAFADAVPADFESYKFYEKEYLRSLGTGAAEFYTWVNSGAAVIGYKGKTCVIADFLPSQDPIAVLGDKVDESSLNQARTGGFVTGSALPEILLSRPQYYIEVFNNRVYMAEEKSAIDELIGVYESGRTLTQNVERYTQLFGNSPRRISVREIGGSEHKTISLLDGSRHTVIRKIAGAALETAKKNTSGLEPLRIEGGIERVIPVPNSDFLFVVARSGSVYGINNNDIRWTITPAAKPVAPAALSGRTEELLLVTANDVRLISRNGQERITQGRNSEILAAVSFNWKGLDQVCIIDRQGILITASNGRKTSIPYAFANTNSEVVVWVNRGELRISVLNGNQLITFSADRKRKLKEASVADSQFLVKSEQGPYVYSLSGRNAQRTNWNGEQFAVLSNVRKMERQNSSTLLFYTPASVVATNAEGAVITTLKTSFANPEAAFYLENSGSAISVLDGIANRNYVYGVNGARLSSEDFEGSAITALQKRANGQLLLISQSNGYIVRYRVK